MPPVQHFTVTPDESGQKLVQFLQRRLGSDVPRSLFLRLVRKGQVRVDKGRKKPFDRVTEGQVVRVPPIHIEEKEPGTSVSTLPVLPVIYDAGGLLAINKPAGLPVHPGSGHDEAVNTRLKAQFPDAPFEPTPAHRLDRDTSGVLLCGRSYSTLRKLQDAFREHTIDKFYLCWVHGSFEVGTRWDMQDSLAKSGPAGRMKVQVGSGKHAHAIAECLAVREDYSLFCVQLLTGRTHQIRVQMTERGAPLVGDKKYGRSKKEPMLLHAWRIVWNEIEIAVLPDWAPPFDVKGLVS